MRAHLSRSVLVKRRCAVYTRKSSEEGLDQAFNSLDAQREACEAYVLSQKAEGWLLLSDRYDDGGHSGGTLERPALQRLIRDIEAGGIDVVVVYKIDRLSRSLMDFSRLVDVFERHHVTFVSVMRHLLGENFTIAVLDDVLMSVDAGHRREVCTLLKESFTATQFIFTTHDEIWLKHMKSEGLIKGRGFAHFRTWNVDAGPAEWDDRDVWAELSVHLGKNDVRAAAALLRHYLEHFAKEACDRLRASVEFRGDAQFTLGDLLPNATRALGDHFKKAKAAANSWNQVDTIETIAARESAFTDAKTRTGHEQWQINAAVHFNGWADLQKADFEHVVSAFSCLGLRRSAQRFRQDRAIRGFRQGPMHK